MPEWILYHEENKQSVEQSNLFSSIAEKKGFKFKKDISYNHYFNDNNEKLDIDTESIRT